MHIDSIAEFEAKQIKKANYIKDKALTEIETIEAEIKRLKDLIKEEKKRIKQADKDIINYSI